MKRDRLELTGPEGNASDFAAFAHMKIASFDQFLWQLPRWDLHFIDRGQIDFWRKSRPPHSWLFRL